MSRATDFYQAAIRVFGEGATVPKERVLRFVEEAIELAQACGITRHTVDQTTDRTYGRPEGNIEQEFAQCMVTLEMAALRLNVDLNAAADEEFKRFMRLPADFWKKKWEAKRKIGIVFD